MNKGPPRKVAVEDMSDALAEPTIETPFGAPDVETDGILRVNKRRRDLAKLDPRKKTRPDLPITGPGRGGRVGASATQHVVQNLVRDTTRDEDVSTLVEFDGLRAKFRSLEKRCSSTQTNQQKI